MRFWASSFGWTSLALVPFVALAIGCGGTPDAPQANPNTTAATNPEETEEPNVPDPTPSVDRAPEQAAADTLRKLLIAMVERDQATIESITLPHPELAMLWFGEKNEPEEVARLKGAIDLIAFSKLLPGDNMIDLSGKPIQIKATDVKDNQLLVTFPSSPIPFFLEKQGGVWKVHPAPIIASRKASIAEMEAMQAEAQKGDATGAGSVAQPPVQQPAVQTADQLGGTPPRELKR